MKAYKSTDHVLIDMGGKVPKEIKDRYQQDIDAMYIGSLIVLSLMSILFIIAGYLFIRMHIMAAIRISVVLAPLTAYRIYLQRRMVMYSHVVTAYYLVKNGTNTHENP